MNPKTYVLVGASRGIGGAAANYLADRGHRVLAVSRGAAVAGEWVRADIATDDGIDAVVAALSNEPLDGFLYLGGTWEEGAFTDAYDFARSSRTETRTVIAVNLVAPILLAQALVPNLARSQNPRIILMGALSGLAGRASREVANTAAKFGLQGAAHALALSLRDRGIGVSVINPGNVATPEVEDDIREGRFGKQVPIAMADMLATLDYLLAVGPYALPAEVTLEQMRPG
jgi:NAD(P)-dependent dehydrogenase (short-subunit alcohol dehydrogenase family)